MGVKPSFGRFCAGKPDRALSRFGILAVLLSVLSLSAGCAGSLHAKSSRPVRVEPMDIMLQTDAASFGLAGLGIFPFSAPHYAGDAGKDITDQYWGELLAKGVFRQLKIIPHAVGNDEEAVWWGRREDCDLVMVSKIKYFMDGSGGLPTQLETNVRIIDVRSGRLLWDLEQKAYSDPGPDVDLFWTTIPGSPAQRCRLLAKSLARQLADYLSSPLEGQKK